MSHIPTRRTSQLITTVTKEDLNWPSEEKIPKDWYDQPKNHDGHVDDQNYHQPHRHITNWFLTKTGQEVNLCREALPESNNIYNTKINKLTLYGELECDEKKSYRLFKTRITSMKAWTFDKHFLDRGIWVQTSCAWYKLKQPCKKLITLSDGSQTSQEIIHRPLRAKCALISNLLDMMSNSNGLLYHPSVKFHAGKTPSESFSAWLNIHSTDIEPKNVTKGKPFDLDLLKRDPKFIKMQLGRLDSSFSKSCCFMKALMQLEKSLQDSRKRNEDWLKQPFDYLTSAEEAEFRSNREPWGCPRLDEQGKWNCHLTSLGLQRLKTLKIENSTEFFVDSNRNNANKNIDSLEEKSGTQINPDAQNEPLLEQQDIKDDASEKILEYAETFMNSTHATTKEKSPSPSPYPFPGKALQLSPQQEKIKTEQKVTKAEKKRTVTSTSSFSSTLSSSIRPKKRKHSMSAPTKRELFMISTSESFGKSNVAEQCNPMSAVSLSSNSLQTSSTREKKVGVPADNFVMRELKLICPSDSYCKLHIVAAKKMVGKYLDPETHGVKEALMEKFVKFILNEDQIYSFEFLYVYLDCLIASSENVKRLLFYFEDRGCFGAQTIFIKWMEKSIKVMRTRYVFDKTRQAQSICAQTCEHMVAYKIIELLLSFSFLSKKKLSNFKATLDLDLNRCVSELHDFAEKTNNNELIDICAKAKTFLDNPISCMPHKRLSSTPTTASKKQLENL